MYTQAQIKESFEKIVNIACKESGTFTDKYKVKMMGRAFRYDSMKCGFYVQIQNFTSLTKAKKSRDNQNIRYYFRCIMFANREKPLFEIAKWMPSMGSVENEKIIFRDDDKRYEFTFEERMITAMNFVKLKM